MVARRREFLLAGVAGLVALGCGNSDKPDEPAQQALDPQSQRQGDAEVLAFLLEEKRPVLAAAAGVPAVLAAERAHVKRLEDEIRALNAKVPPTGPERELELLAAEENFIAAAIDALPKLADEKRRALLASIMTADAGHVAFLRARDGEEPVTDAFVYGRKAA